LPIGKHPVATSFKHPDVVDVAGAVTAWWRRLLVAAAFLTCLPLASRVPGRSAADAATSMTGDTALPATQRLSELTRATGLFPLVGAAIGLIAGLALLGAFELGLHPLACAFIAIATAIGLSGALHEDGLSDFADGLGGATREARLAIMRDNRIGTFGALALVFGVGLRASILSGLSSPDAAVFSLISAAALSRAVLPAVMHRQKPARTDGLSAAIGAPGNAEVATAAVLALLIALFAIGFWASLLAAAAAGIAALAVASLAQYKLGGQTGDVLGAVQVVAEVAALAAIAIVE
jgi:adenosylcobinamide-GDP ribazoletransferase